MTNNTLHIKYKEKKKSLNEALMPVSPYVRGEPDRTTSRICQLFNYTVQRAVQSPYEFVRQLPQECLEGGEAQITEKCTRSSTPGFLQQNPQAVIISHLQLAQALLFIFDPKWCSIERCVVGSEQIYFHIISAIMEFSNFKG